jgi:hypothetical protein
MSLKENGLLAGINDQGNHNHKTPDSAWLYVGAHNVYYVKLTW